MRITPSVVTRTLVAALVVVAVLRFWAQGGDLPPHEFAYGTALKSSEAIPLRMDQFFFFYDMETTDI